MGDPFGNLIAVRALAYAGMACMFYAIVLVPAGMVTGLPLLVPVGHGAFALGFQVAMVAVVAETVLFPWK